MFGGDVRPTHRDSDRFRQIADPFSKTSRFWTLFTQWVCTLATTPPQLAAPPPPNGGNCIIRAATRRRYSASQLLMLQNPHHSKPEVRRIVYKSLAQHRLVRRNLSSTPQTTDFRPFFVRRANFFALTPTIRPSRANFFAHRTPPAATMQPMTPPQPLMQASMKPPSPLRALEKQPLKPTTPLQPKNAPKTPISHPQRR